MIEKSCAMLKSSTEPEYAEEIKIVELDGEMWKKSKK